MLCSRKILANTYEHFPPWRLTLQCEIRAIYLRMRCGTTAHLFSVSQYGVLCLRSGSQLFACCGFAALLPLAVLRSVWLLESGFIQGGAFGFPALLGVQVA